MKTSDLLGAYEAPEAPETPETPEAPGTPESPESPEMSDFSDVFGSPETSEQSRSKVRAIRILGNRHMSSKEMEKRLISKGDAEDTARETVQWLENIGAVDDKEFAAAIVSHYSEKGYGLARIKDEMYRRGIPRDMWDDALTSLEDKDTDEAVQRFLEKKLKGSCDKDDLRRATDALCRRGFSYEEARTAVNRYLESVENTEDC